MIACLFSLFLMAGSLYAQSGQSETARKFDEFGGTGCEDMMARLDNYAIALQSEPSLTAYIIVYGGQAGQRGEAQMWAGRARYYLVSNRRIDARKLRMSIGGYRDSWAMELWLLRRGGPLPDAKPTVQFKDVKFKRGRIRKPQYRCEM
jgi:hypothetical protein